MPFSAGVGTVLSKRAEILLYRPRNFSYSQVSCVCVWGGGGE